MLSESAVSGELKVPFYAAIGSTHRANIELYQPYIWQVQANATTYRNLNAFWLFTK